MDRKVYKDVKAFKGLLASQDHRVYRAYKVLQAPVPRVQLASPVRKGYKVLRAHKVLRVFRGMSVLKERKAFRVFLVRKVQQARLVLKVHRAYKEHLVLKAHRVFKVFLDRLQDQLHKSSSMMVVLLTVHLTLRSTKQLTY